MRLSVLKKLILGVHGVKELFFRLEKNFDRQVEI